MTAPLLLPATATHDLPPDGVTAHMKPLALLSVGEQVWRPDANGNYVVRITIFQNSGSGWAQVSMPASFRVFVYEPDVQVSHAENTSPVSVSVSVHASTDGWQDKLLIPFTSSATEHTLIAFPSSTIGTPSLISPQPFDAFVTFAASGLEGHTSHFSQARNQLIMLGQHDAADALDYHGTVYPIGI